MGSFKICSKCNVLKSLSDFPKRKESIDGTRNQCKSCRYIVKRSYVKRNLDEVKENHKKWSKENREKVRSYYTKDKLSSGYCVYKAEYSCGTYIGSGIASVRRRHHLNGSSGIGRKLSEKAISFKVLVKGSQQYCLEIESKFIDKMGLDSLLNQLRVKSYGKFY